MQVGLIFLSCLRGSEHVDSNHANAKVEQSRGNLAITDADYLAVPQVINNPDYVIYGAKNKIGRDMIAYLKQLDDGSLLYLEEIRTGKEKLALQSMRKYPPTTNATSILKSLRPTSKTASADSVISIVDRRKNDQPLYSRNFVNGTANSIGDALKNLSVQSAKDRASYSMADWLKVGLPLLGRRQLAEIYSPVLPQLNQYNRLAAQMDADQNDAGAKADNIVREWSKLKDEQQLAELMHDATLAQIDPAKPRVPTDNVVKYNALRKAYDALAPDAKDMYTKARDAYASHYSDVHGAIKERILRSELSSQKKADLMKQIF